MKKSKISRKKLYVCITAVLAAVILAAGSVIACYIYLEKNKPVITGVQSHLVVYEDDSAEKVQEILLKGVSTVGGKPCAVQVSILSHADGQAVKTLTAGEYALLYTCEQKRVDSVSAELTVKPADTTPPIIKGTADHTVVVNGSVSYREGVTVTDDCDANVTLEIDSSKVDLTTVGKYPVIYSATDNRGNNTQTTVTVTVTEKQALEQANAKKEKLDAMCDKILKSILKDGMSEREKAEAIFNRVRKIQYVGTADKADWVENAYTGLSRGKGDCRNYSAASRALLTQAGIPCYELQRVGGTTDHFWQIAYVDGGWYHFDPCPTSKKHPIRCFLLTDEEVIAYSNSRKDKPNYYIYDHDACPHQVVQSRNP